MSAAFIAEMAWKSAVISIAALGLVAVLRSRSAADRAAVIRLSLMLLLGMPVISLGLPHLVIAQPELTVPALQPAAPVSLPNVASAAPAAEVAHTVPSPRLTLPPLAPLVTGLYLIGTLAIVARLLAGLWTLRRWTREAEPVTSPAWTGALTRLGGGKVRLLATDRIGSPLSWGVLRPVVLIDRASLARRDGADAILAHELAHIACKDWLALVLARLTVALFWANPLVWRLERALIEQAEEAADLQAVRRVDATRYASTLLDCLRAAQGLRLPANAMAAGAGLSRRMGAILDPKRRGARPGSAWTAVAMLGVVGVAGPVAALELVSAPATPLAVPMPAPVPTPTGVGSAAVIPPHSTAQPNVDSDAARRLADRARRAQQLAREASEKARAKQQEARLAARASREAAQAAREADLAAREADEAERRAREMARSEEVETPPFAVSVRNHRPRVDEALAQALRQAGYDDVSERQLVGMTAMHVSPEFITDLAAVGYRDLSLSQLTAMWIHKVSASEIREFAALGYSGLTPEQLVQMRVLRVTPDFVRELAASGRRNLTVQELVRMRLVGFIDGPPLRIRPPRDM